MDAGDAVAREEEGVQARGEGEVGEGGDVVVGEVDGVLVLRGCWASVHTLPGVLVLEVRRGGERLTFATPRFSMAGILWPVVRAY